MEARLKVEDEKKKGGTTAFFFLGEGRWVAGLWKWEESLGRGERRLERLVSGLWGRRVSG
jgi:hypothetical protein